MDCRQSVVAHPSLSLIDFTALDSRTMLRRRFSFHRTHVNLFLMETNRFDGGSSENIEIKVLVFSFSPEGLLLLLTLNLFSGTLTLSTY